MPILSRYESLSSHRAPFCRPIDPKSCHYGALIVIYGQKNQENPYGPGIEEQLS